MQPWYWKFLEEGSLLEDFVWFWFVIAAVGVPS